jgi:hypothetical protein
MEPASVPNDRTGELSRDEIDQLPGPVLLEFGTQW